VSLSDCDDVVTLLPRAWCSVQNGPCLLYFKPVFVINRAGIDTDYITTKSNLKTHVLLGIVLNVM
jgi:hypothetical protein